MAAQSGKIALTFADVAHRTLVTCLFGMSVYGATAIGVQVDKSRKMVQLAREDNARAELAAENSALAVPELLPTEPEKKPAQWFTRD